MSRSIPFIVAIVDRDEQERRVLRTLLEESGYVVVEPGPRTEAPRLLSEYPWDLLLVDLDDDGSESDSLLRLVKSNTDLETRYALAIMPTESETRKIEALDRGADDCLSRPISPAELLAKIRSGRRVMDLNNKLFRLNKQLELLSITDDLTNLYNRRSFLEQFGRAMEQTARYHRPLSLLLVDIDHFKQVNDRFGHHAGDKLLQEFSNVLAQSSRSTDLVARYGGDEFAIVAAETSREEALSFAERIRESAEQLTVDVDGVEIRITASVGVASAPHEGIKTISSLMEQADKALYRAKQHGRNCVRMIE